MSPYDMQASFLSPVKILKSVFGKCNNLTDTKPHSVRTPARHLNTNMWMKYVNRVVGELVPVRYDRRRIILRLR